jgi:hypothetical protein
MTEVTSFSPLMINQIKRSGLKQNQLLLEEKETKDRHSFGVAVFLSLYPTKIVRNRCMPASFVMCFRNIPYTDK